MKEQHRLRHRALCLATPWMSDGGGCAGRVTGGKRGRRNWSYSTDSWDAHLALKRDEPSLRVAPRREEMPYTKADLLLVLMEKFA